MSVTRPRLWKQLAAALRAERGVTLIELLVAMSAGLIVCTAMAAIVITSVHFGSSSADRVDSNQEGRIAMQKITQALESACVANAVPPIVSTSSGGSTGASGATGSTGAYVSDGTHMWFYTALAPGITVSDGATINPSLVEVYLSSSGSLVMDTYPYVSGSAPSSTNTNPWTFSSTASSSFTLLPDAAQTVNSNGTVPIFQYYPYTSGTGTISTTALTTPLTAATAATAAEVLISFRAMPSDGNTNDPGSAYTDISDSVVLRLTPASSSASATNTPCS